MAKTLILGAALLGVIYLGVIVWLRWLLDKDDREAQEREMLERIRAAQAERTWYHAAYEEEKRK